MSTEYPACVRELYESVISRFKEIAGLGSAEDGALLRGMVSHEAAVLSWLTLEADGPHNHSLDEMIAQPQYALPRR